MTFLSRLAIAAGVATRAEDSSTPPTPAGVMPPSRDRIETVTPRDALTLDAVYRAVSILQTAALQLTIDVRRGGQVITPTPSLAARPYLDDHLGGFLATTVSDLALRGNAYWRRRRGPEGTVINLEPLRPLEVLPYRDSRGRVRYAVAGEDEDLTARDVSHLKLLRVGNDLLGLGPIQAAAATLRGHLDVARYGAEWFRQGEVPSGVLSTDQHLTATQAAEWKAQWKAQRAQHDTAVLGSGLAYTHLSLKPAEVQWLESQRFNTTAVARLFGIPSRQMLASVEGSSTTYANSEQEDRAFLKYTLMAYLREVELALTDALPRGQEARFNVDALLRTDTLTRFQAHELGVRSGFLTVDEVRATEGLDPLDHPTPIPAGDAA